MKLLSMHITALGLGLCLTAFAGCRGQENQKGPAPDSTGVTAPAKPEGALELSFEPTAEQLHLAEGFAQSVDAEKWRFTLPEASEPAHAGALLHLAATSKDDAVVGAALYTLGRLRLREQRPDEDFARLVRHHLNAESDRLAGVALDASRSVVGRSKEDKALVDAVAGLVERTPFHGGGGRIQLVEALVSYGKRHQTARTTDVVLGALDATEAYTVARTLEFLADNPFPAAQARVTARALALSVHTDPAIRGKAVALLGRQSRVEEVVEATTKALGDPSPYVRAEACAALGRLGHVPSVHALIKHVDDAELGRAEVLGPMNVQSEPGRRVFQATPSGFVQEPCIDAVRTLSGRAFQLEVIAPKDVEAGMGKNAKLAKAWYAQNKSKLDREKALPTLEKASTTARRGLPRVTPGGADTAP